MDLGLTDRVYIVLGATGGLGLACARLLRDENTRLIVTGRDEDELTAVLEQIGGGDDVMALPADISDPGTETRLVAAAVARYGRLDGGILVCEEGQPPGPTLVTADTTWRQDFENVFLGPLRLARSMGRAAGGEGASIVVVLDAAAREARAEAGTVNGLHAAMAHTAKALADELGPQGVRVNTLLAGRIETDSLGEGSKLQTQDVPLRRTGFPDELARAAVFLLSPAASYITGSTLAVDGGLGRSL